MKKKPDLTVIIPVYNEEKRVKKGIQKISQFLNKQSYSWELIIVDDGSKDQTVSIVETLIKNTENIKTIKNPHLGKGGAIKKGVLEAHGSWSIFLDIDLATPISELSKFMKQRGNNDILIGSRKMKGAKIIVHQPPFREFGGKIFTFLTNTFVTNNISDITCGFKLFKTSVAKKLFNKSILTNWSFDAEILFLAQKSGHRIKEIPVIWKDDPQTRVNLFTDTIDSFLGLLKIRFNDFQGKYS